MSNASLRAFRQQQHHDHHHSIPPKLPVGVSPQPPVQRLPLSLILSRFPCLRLGFIVVDRKVASHIRFLLRTVSLRFQSWLPSSPTPRRSPPRGRISRNSFLCRVSQIPRSYQTYHFPRWVFPPGLGGLADHQSQRPVQSRPVFSGSPAAAPCRLGASKQASKAPAAFILRRRP